MRTASIVLVAALSSLIGAAAGFAASAISTKRDQNRLPDLENALGIRAWDVHVPADAHIGVRLASSDGVVASSGLVRLGSQELRLVMYSDRTERGLKHVSLYDKDSRGSFSIRVPDTYQVEQPTDSRMLSPGSVLVKYGEKSASNLAELGHGEVALMLHVE